MLGHPFKVKNKLLKLKNPFGREDWNTYATTMVSKLLGYNFLVEYKKGQDNKVIDTLSRRNEEEKEEFTLLVIFYPTLEWLTDLKDGYISNAQLHELL